MSWQNLTRSKSLGGFGYEKFNTALLAKQFWRLSKEPNTLWAKFLKSIYFPNADVWEVPVPRLCSWSWRSLLHGREFLKRHRSWVIGNGKSVRVEGDRWIKDGQRIISGVPDAQNLSVADIIIPETKVWDIRKINTIFSPETVKDILAVPIANRDVEDRFIWPHSTDGNYSVRTGYQALVADMSNHNPSSSHGYLVDKPLWNAIWSAKTIPKVKSFIWKICKETVASRSNLFKRKLLDDNLCCVCGAEGESILHIFTACHWVRAFCLVVLFIGM